MEYTGSSRSTNAVSANRKGNSARKSKEKQCDVPASDKQIGLKREKCDRSTPEMHKRQPLANVSKKSKNLEISGHVSKKMQNGDIFTSVKKEKKDSASKKLQVDAETEETISNSDLKLDVSKIKSIESTGCSTNAASAKRTGNTSRQSKEKQCDVPASDKQTRQSIKREKCDRSTPEKHKRQSSANVSKKSKKLEIGDLSVSGKQSGLASGNDSKRTQKCDILASVKKEKKDSITKKLQVDAETEETISNSDLKFDVSKIKSIESTGSSTNAASAKRTGNTSRKSKEKQCDVPASDKQTGQSIKREKCDRSTPEKHKRQSSANVSKKSKKLEIGDISVSGKQSGPASGNDSKKTPKCDISASVNKEKKESTSKKLQMDTKTEKTISNNGFKCDVSKSKSVESTGSSTNAKSAKRKGNTPRKSKEKQCDVPASHKQTGQYIKPENCNFSASGKQSGNISIKSQNCDISTSGKEENKTPAGKKAKIKLRPSDIRYSQGSISSQFQDGTNIGQLLDDIFFGRRFVLAIPLIEVSNIKGKWVSADNRRLWVFKHLEILGRVDFIIVKVTKKIYFGKLTSENKGLAVEIRNGEPKGLVYSSMYADSKKSIDGNAESVPERKCRRRKRKTKISGNNNSHVDQNKDRSEPDLEGSGNLSTTSSDSDDSQDTFANGLENLIQYNQDIVDENTYFNIYDYNGRDDWMDGDSLSDTFFEENAVSESETPNDWFEYESEKIENEIQFNQSINRAFTENESRARTQPAFLTTTEGFGPQNDTEYPSLQRQIFDNAQPTKASLETRKEHFTNQNATKTSCTTYSETFDTCYCQSSDSNMGLEDFGSIGQVETYLSNRQDFYQDLWGNYDCVRCTRMRFFNELDIGPYYEPTCGRLKASHKRPPRYPVSAGIIIWNDKTNSKEKTFLSKVSDGIEAVAGFLNKIFS